MFYYRWFKYSGKIIWCKESKKKHKGTIAVISLTRFPQKLTSPTFYNKKKRIFGKTPWVGFPDKSRPIEYNGIL